MALEQTVGVLDEMSITWAIENLDLNAIEGLVYSPLFTIQNCAMKWRLYFYFHKEEEEDSESLGIFIQDESDSTVPVSFLKLIIINARRDTVKKRDIRDADFPKSKKGVGFKSFVKRSVLYAARCLTPDEKLTMKVRVTCKLQQNDVECDALKEFADYHQILLKEKFSDVKFIVEGMELHAHKAILSARSSYFAEMFQRPPVGNEIRISDVACDVFKKVLEYIYVGQVTDVESCVNELIFAADVYSVTGLKSICEKTISDAITPKNVIKYLSLSHMCRATKLKMFALEFIKRHLREVVSDPDFKDFGHLDPNLICSVVYSIATAP